MFENARRLLLVEQNENLKQIERYTESYQQARKAWHEEETYMNNLIGKRDKLADELLQLSVAEEEIASRPLPADSPTPSNLGPSGIDDPKAYNGPRVGA